MKVLITGAFGFLGGRFAQYLDARGDFELRLASRHARAAPDWLPRAQVARTRWECAEELDAACAGVDAIVHMAGMNARDCADDPVGALEINALATARLTRAAVGQAVKRFVYLSTAHVYGAPLAGVITEETCTAPAHPYASSHRAGEDAVRDAARQGAIEGVVIRLSNTYGVPAHKDVNCWMLLINDLCRQAVATRCMVLRSTGLQKRDFVPLPEVCRALGHVLCLPAGSGNLGVVNVGSSASVTVWEAAMHVRERCAATLGFRPELERVTPGGAEQETPLDYRMDVLRRLGFEPAARDGDEIDNLLRFCANAFA